jgi:dUTP pyrophosphatase
MNVAYKAITEGAKHPEFQSKLAAGFDLRAVGTHTIEYMQTVVVPTGLAIATPETHALLILARSSLFLRHGVIVANGVGLIDPDYAGDTDEIKVILHCLRPTGTVIPHDARIAQGMFVPIDRAEFNRVESMTASARGGFGSTGTI